MNSSAQLEEALQPASAGGSGTAGRRAGPPVGAAGIFARAGWNGFGSILSLVAQLLITPYMLRELGLDRYGIWALIGVIVAFVSAADGGVGASLAYFFAVHRGAGNVAAASRLAASTILLFLAVGGAITVALAAAMPTILSVADVPLALQDEALALRSLVGLLVTVGFLASLFTALLQANDRYRAIGLIAAARVATILIGTSIALKMGGGLRALTLVNLVAVCSAVILSATVGRHYLKIVDAAPLQREERKALWSYASRMQVSSLTALISIQVDALVIGLLLPVRYVGLYVIGANAAYAVRALPLYMLPPVFTHFSVRYSEGGLAAAVDTYRRISPKWIAAITGYVAVALASIPFVVRMWLGPEHAQSAYVAVLVLIGYGVNLITGVASTFARSIGRPGLETRYALCATVLNVILSIPLGVLFGLYGVIVATTIGSVIGSIYFFRILDRSVNEELGSPWSEVRPMLALACVVVSLVGELVVMFSGVSGLGGLALTCVPAGAGLAVYGWSSRKVLLGLVGGGHSGVT